MNHPRAFSLWTMLAAFLLLPCTALLSITTYQTQGAINTMEAEIYFALLLSIALLVNRFVEGVKRLVLVPAQERLELSDEVYSGIVLVLTFVAAFVASLAANANALLIVPIATSIPALFGVLISAALISGGAQAIHGATELWTLIQDLLSATTDRVQPEPGEDAVTEPQARVIALQEVDKALKIAEG